MSLNDQATAHIWPPQPPPTAGRHALALGMVGALGDELLAQLLADGRYAAVHVGVRRDIGSATLRMRPFTLGAIGPDSHARLPPIEAAWLCLTDAATFVPQAQVIRALAAGELRAAAQLAQRAGAQRLVLVAPLSALLQLNAVARAISSDDELALAQMGFAALIVVRPTAQESERGPGGAAGLVRTAGRALADIMLPAFARPLSARSAARAIKLAADQAGAGVTVLGARELLALLQAREPQRVAARRRLW